MDVRESSGKAPRSYNKWAILFTVLVMTFMSCLDSSIVTVALPVMQKELAAGLDQIQWVSSVYLLATCIGVLPFGRLGDARGKVYVFQAGVVVFTLGSLLCGLATTLPVLVCARVVQGVGCAAPFRSTPARPCHTAPLLQQKGWDRRCGNDRSHPMCAGCSNSSARQCSTHPPRCLAAGSPVRAGCPPRTPGTGAQPSCLAAESLVSAQENATATQEASTVLAMRQNAAAPTEPRTVEPSKSVTRVLNTCCQR